MGFFFFPSLLCVNGSGRQISPRVEGGMAAAENKMEKDEHSNKLQKKKIKPVN